MKITEKDLIILERYMLKLIWLMI